jgi:plastocyanin domain-containing protein
MNKTVSLIITAALIFAAVIIFWDGSVPFSNSNSPSVANVSIKDGIQYVKITAKGGYVPNLSLAKAGIPTKLLMDTVGTFDCSSSLVIKSINYQNILPPNGETEIDIGTWKAGETMKGLCSMGMYNFQIRFN